MLQAAQQHGITHPTVGGFLQLPREFDAILALEHKAVAQVVLEILRQTIGREGDGQGRRQEWATISYRHFARAGLMTSKAAQRGIQGALEKRYILRRKVGERRYEYAIRWKGSNYPCGKLRYSVENYGIHCTKLIVQNGNWCSHSDAIKCSHSDYTS